MENETSATLLQLNNISVVYSDVIQVLKGVSLTVPEGGIVACLAPTAPARPPRCAR